MRSKESSCTNLFPILSFSPMMNSETLIAPPKSSWLHRLRSARGFPDSDHIDLDHFLTTLSIDPQTSTPQPTHNRINVDTETVQDHDSINTILSELFHMGEFQHKSRLNTKKSSRKQNSPRMCLVSNNSTNLNPSRNVSKLSPQLNVSLNGGSKVKEVKSVEEDDDEEEKCDWDVTGYSQTEVTVIDTSVASWKFEKVLYRRKNIWKVGNKKGKGLMSGDRKKRKACVSDNGDVHKKKLKMKSRDEEEVGEKKKKKKKKLKLCNSLKYVDKEDDNVQGHEQDKTKVAAYEKKQDNCSQVQEKSFLKKQIDGESSVILIKSIPITNKKDASGISKSCVKSMQK